ncbi:MAG: DUF4382 domain-containing protein [Dehalococcoidia bacterium]|nr:DUF4382 domain-containing protein [Dehalococcoidia bacterium]
MKVPMKRSILFLSAIITALAVVLMACSSTQSTSSTGAPAPATGTAGTGKAVFVMSDAAADMGTVTSVQVTVDGLRVHSTGGAWTIVAVNSQTYDLLALRSQNSAKLLADATLNVGSYDQMELSIAKASVVDSKGMHEAVLPSGKLQIKGDLDVKSGATATVNFDFLADQSLHLTGEGRYILAPIVKVEARSSADAQVQSDGFVKISGGSTTADTTVGMDVEGNVDAGLRISPDAVLSISASGKIVQPKGQALAVGVVKAVDTANGTVTLTTKSGNDMTLHIASNSTLKAKRSSVDAKSLSTNVGTEAAVEYNTETKAIAQLVADTDAKARADVGSRLSLSGSVKSVDNAMGTVVIVTDSGTTVTVTVDNGSKVQLDGLASNLLRLNSKPGARVYMEYNPNGNIVRNLSAEGHSIAVTSGWLKALDIGKSTLTLDVGGRDLTLSATSSSRLLVNGSIAPLASLKGMIGSRVTVAYGQDSKALASLDATGSASTPPATNAGASVNVGSATVGVGAGGNASVTPVAPAAPGSQRQVSGSASASSRTKISGTLKTASLANNTLTVTTAGGLDITLKVADNSGMTLNGSPVSLATLSNNTGSVVEGEFNPETSTVLTVDAKPKVQFPPGTILRATGTFREVNTIRGTVAVNVDGADIILLITQQSVITVGGNVTNMLVLSTVPVGKAAAIKYRADTKELGSLTVQ